MMDSFSSARFGARLQSPLSRSSTPASSEFEYSYSDYNFTTSPECVRASSCYVAAGDPSVSEVDGFPTCEWLTALTDCGTPVCAGASEEEQDGLAVLTIFQNCLCNNIDCDKIPLDDDDGDDGSRSCVRNCEFQLDSGISALTNNDYHDDDSMATMCTFWSEGGDSDTCARWDECTAEDHAVTLALEECACSGIVNECSEWLSAADDDFANEFDTCLVTHCMTALIGPDATMCAAVADRDSIRDAGIETFCPGITSCFGDSGIDFSGPDAIFMEVSLISSISCSCDDTCEEEEEEEEEEEDDVPVDPTLPEGACSCDPTFDQSTCPVGPFDFFSATGAEIEATCVELRTVQDEHECCFGSNILPAYTSFMTSLINSMLNLDSMEGRTSQTAQDTVTLKVLVAVAIRDSCSLSNIAGGGGCSEDTCPGSSDPSIWEETVVDDESSEEDFVITEVISVDGSLVFTLPEFDVNDGAAFEALKGVLEASLSESLGVCSMCVTVNSIADQVQGARKNRRNLAAGPDITVDFTVKQLLTYGTSTAMEEANALFAVLSAANTDGTLAETLARHAADEPLTAALAEPGAITVASVELDVESATYEDIEPGQSFTDSPTLAPSPSSLEDSVPGKGGSSRASAGAAATVIAVAGIAAQQLFA